MTSGFKTRCRNRRGILVVPGYKSSDIVVVAFTMKVNGIQGDTSPLLASDSTCRGIDSPMRRKWSFVHPSVLPLNSISIVVVLHSDLGGSSYHSKLGHRWAFPLTLLHCNGVNFMTGKSRSGNRHNRKEVSCSQSGKSGHIFPWSCSEISLL